MTAHIPKHIDDAIGAFYTPTIGEEPGPFDITKPERNLIAQLVAFAINEAYSSTNFTKQIRRDAQEWLRSNDLENTPFTFTWCCLILELDPEAIREVLKEGKYNFEVKGRTMSQNGTISDIIAVMNSI